MLLLQSTGCVSFKRCLEKLLFYPPFVPPCFHSSWAKFFSQRHWFRLPGKVRITFTAAVMEDLACYMHILPLSLSHYIIYIYI